MAEGDGGVQVHRPWLGPGPSHARSGAQSALPRAKKRGFEWIKPKGWRRRRDSNPRYAFGAYNGLANRRLQPLGHVSVSVMPISSLPSRQFASAPRMNSGLNIYAHQTAKRINPTREPIMTRLFGGAIALVLLASLAQLNSPVRAETEYPWCAQYGGGRDGIDATNCGFETIAQCRATISGLSGICYENPRYPGKAVKSHRRYHSPG
jgi:Protein of unknown function (DUF3551)